MNMAGYIELSGCAVLGTATIYLLNQFCSRQPWWLWAIILLGFIIVSIGVSMDK